MLDCNGITLSKLSAGHGDVFFNVSGRAISLQILDYGEAESVIWGVSSVYWGMANSAYNSGSIL